MGLIQDFKDGLKDSKEDPNAERDVNSFFMNVGIGCFYFAVGVSGYATYILWFGDELDSHDSHTGYIAQMSMLVLFALSLGLLLVHSPKGKE